MQWSWYYDCKKIQRSFELCCAVEGQFIVQGRTHLKVSDHLWIIDTEAMCQSPWSGLETESRLNVHQPWPQPDRVTHPHRHTRSHAEDLQRWQHSPTDQWDELQLPDLREAASWQKILIVCLFLSLLWSSYFLCLICWQNRYRCCYKRWWLKLIRCGCYPCIFSGNYSWKWSINRCPPPANPRG